MAKGKVATLPAAAVVALLALALALNGVSAAVNSNPDFTAPATLTVLHGDVLVRHGDSAEVPALDDQALQAGDVVRTEVEARAVISYFDGSHVALEPATELAIETLTRSSAGDIVVLMRQSAGRTWHVVTRALSASSRYEVRTPAATATVRGTAFAVDYDGTMRVTTTEGVVRTGNARGAVDVTPGLTTAAREGSAPIEPVVAPKPARVVTVIVSAPNVVSAPNATVTDPAGRPIVVKDSKILRAVPLSTAERRADGSVVVTMPDIPSGTVTSHVKTSASAVDINVQVREGDRVVSEATERREVRDGTAKGGVELAPDGRVTPLDDDEARKKPDPKISRPAAPPAAPDKVAAKEAAPTKPAEVARLAPAAVKPEAPKLAPIAAVQEGAGSPPTTQRSQHEGTKAAPVTVAPSASDGKSVEAKKDAKKKTEGAPSTAEKRAAAAPHAPVVESKAVSESKREGAPAKVETSGGSAKAEGAADDREGGKGGDAKGDPGADRSSTKKDGSGSGEDETRRQASGEAPTAVAASVAVEWRDDHPVAAPPKVDQSAGAAAGTASAKDEKRGSTHEDGRSSKEETRKADAQPKDEARRSDQSAKSEEGDRRQADQGAQRDNDRSDDRSSGAGTRAKK